jgi:hypothetical protein
MSASEGIMGCNAQKSEMEKGACIYTLIGRGQFSLITRLLEERPNDYKDMGT